MSWGVATQNGVSVSLASIVSLSCGATEFSPAALFTSGVQGAWYDPSDYSTLFQDSAGTTPVTAVEQPVGLMLDKSQGLALTPTAIDGNLNTATWTKGTGWSAPSARSLICDGTQTGSSDTSTTYTKPTGAVVRWSFTISAISGTLTVYPTGGAPSAFTTTGAKTVYSDTASNFNIFRIGAGQTCTITDIRIEIIAGNHATQSTAASRPVLRARYNILLATDTLATQSVTTLATTYKLSFTGVGTITLSGTATGTYSAGTNTITCTAGTLTLTVSGTVTNADLRLSSTSTTMPAYQSVVTSTNYVTTDFLPYLSLDGVDDSYTTSSINFTATDKMSACIGLTKLSGTAEGIVAEHGVAGTNANADTIFSAPGNGGDGFYPFSSSLRPYGGVWVSGASPITAVASVAQNAAAGGSGATNVTIRLNGSLPTQNAYFSSTSTAALGNYPLYIGRRANASLPFNGRIYQMVVCGKALSADELASTEAYVNARTGAY